MHTTESPLMFTYQTWIQCRYDGEAGTKPMNFQGEFDRFGLLEVAEQVLSVVFWTDQLIQPLYSSHGDVMYHYSVLHTIVAILPINHFAREVNQAE